MPRHSLEAPSCWRYKGGTPQRQADADRFKAIAGTRSLSLRAYLLAVAGRSTEARRVLADLEQLRRTVGETPTDPVGGEAYAWLSLGDTARALGALEAAAAVRTPSVLNMLAYPGLKPLSQHPRFQAIRQRVFCR
jgi:hypothetical protein